MKRRNRKRVTTKQRPIITLCATLTGIEELHNDNKGSVKYRAEFTLRKGALKKEDKESDKGITIPVIIQNILLIRPQQCISMTKEEMIKEPVIGTASDLQVGKKYFIRAQFCKTTVIMPSGKRKLVTHIDTKEIYEVNKDFEEINNVNGYFKVRNKSKLAVANSNVYATMKLTDVDNYNIYLTAFAHNKNAEYTSILEEGSLIHLKGVLNATKQYVTDVDSVSNGIKCDAFDIYINKIATQ